ncbi:hypothetical protein MPSEU_000863000 [Mayamaea pseudoterrestris]|nr:hypothetical protein MPSEU_000863000 [Mayamaea pseudoterrestris]
MFITQATINSECEEDNSCDALDLLMDPLKLRQVLSVHDFLAEDDASYEQLLESPLSMQSSSSYSWSSYGDANYFNPFPALSTRSIVPSSPPDSSSPESAPFTDSLVFGPIAPERVCFACKKTKPIFMYCKSQFRRKGSKARCKCCVDQSRNDETIQHKK